MKLFEKLVILTMFFSSVDCAQVLVTGQTSGRGNGVVFVSSNGTSTSDGLGIANNWGGANLGVTNRFDLSLGCGDLALLGRHFPYVLVGGVFALPTQRTHVDVSMYQAVTVPFQNRGNSSTIVNSAFIGSKTFTARSFTFSPYVGASWLYSLGPRDRVLSVPELVFQIPMGVSVPFRERFGLTLEYDHGRTRSVGVALTYSFKFRK